MNGSDYTPGDDLTVEFRVTNLAAEDVMIPWDIHAESVYGTNCEWPRTPGSTGLRGTLYLQIAEYKEVASGSAEFGPDSRTPDGAINASVRLYGISTNPESFRMLATGKSATIKVPGRLYVSPQESSVRSRFQIPKSRKRFSAVAILKLDNSSIWSPYKPLRSTNEFNITVSQK